MLRWLGLALLGILVAAVVAVAASRLASQQIGLASEPVSAGDALAPATEQRAKRPEQGHVQARGDQEKTHSEWTAPPEETAPPATPSAPEGQYRGDDSEPSGDLDD